MSKNYGPTVNPGDVRQRIWRIGGENPNVLAGGSAPQMVFHEEEAVRLNVPADEQVCERPLGRTRDILLPYSKDKLVAIRNPESDVLGPVGRLPAELTQAEAFAVLYSLGRQAQTDQDIAEETALLAPEP